MKCRVQLGDPRGDLTVCDCNLTTVDPHDILQMGVTMTIGDYYQSAK